MRIIAKLDIKPPWVVKPVHFEGLRKVGKPHVLAERYYLDGADEVFYIDIVSSLYQRNIIYKDIKQTASNLFIPFAVGGGIKSIEDCSKLFEKGADKIVINTHALQSQPGIIDEASKLFGSQAVVVSIEAKTYGRNSWICYSDCGRIPSKRLPIDWAKEVQERGAGEILLQSVDTDGRQRGFDINLSEEIVSELSIPVVVASGAGDINHIIEVAKRVQPSGIAIASVLHYNKLNISEIKKAINESRNS